MNLRIIFKQIYRGFFINWKLFLMLIVFCTSTLSLIFGSLSFVVQFNNEIYQPAISKKAFSVGYLNNNFSYSTDSKTSFKTNSKFETYFLKRINEIGQTQSLNNVDLEKIYQSDGYVNWVDWTDFNDQQKEIYEKLINYSADFLGNLRSKLINEYLQEQKKWTFKIRNNQGNVAKLTNNSQQFIHFYTANLNSKKSHEGVIDFNQKIPDDANYISAYVGEKQIIDSYKIGDLVIINLANKTQTSPMKVKIVGTFVDYLTFTHANVNDVSFLIDNINYFNFVRNNFFDENQKIDYSIIDYRNNSILSKPLLTLLTHQKANPLNFVQQFSEANQIITKNVFENFDQNVLNEELSSGIYLEIYQRNLMITFTMIGISVLLMFLFFFMFYFLIAQTIKKDLKLSFFLNGLGVNYWEISFIQVMRLVIPIFLAACFSFLLAFSTKQLFWTAFASTFSITLKTFYFHWLIVVTFLTTIILVFFILVLTNFLINHKLKNNQNFLAQITMVDQIWMKAKRFLKVKKSITVMSFAYGSKNTFQNIFIGLIALVIFTISGFSINFIQNINNISEIASQHYKPIQSISHSNGSMIEKNLENNYFEDYNFAKNKILIPIGDNLDLKTAPWPEIEEELSKLLGNSVTDNYVSSNLIKQIDTEIVEKIEKNIDDESIKDLFRNAYLMNEELKKNFSWTNGFNLTFGQWTSQFLSSNNHHFLNFDGMLIDPQTNNYLRNFNHAFAVNSQDYFFQKKFPNLFDSSSSSSFINQEQKKFQIINAYFPMEFHNLKSLKMTLYLNNEVKVQVEIKNVGLNKFDNWDQIFILNKEQFFQTIVTNLENDSIRAIFENILSNQNFDQLDNGVYSSLATPYFYRNLLLRNDGKGQKLENFLTAAHHLNIYGLNFAQVKKIIVQKLSQFDQLITTIEILLIILMMIISLILIYLVVKENENYFQSFKALGYSAKEISFFLLPWYVGNIVFAAIISSLIVVLTTGLIDNQLSNALAMYLNYTMTPIGIVFLIALPLVFIILITFIIYQFVKKVPIQDAI